MKKIRGMKLGATLHIQFWYETSFFKVFISWV